jgi:hypothetical protein
MLDRVEELLVIDWKSKQNARAGTMRSIEDDVRQTDRFLHKINLQAEVLVELLARLLITPAGTQQ